MLIRTATPDKRFSQISVQVDWLIATMRFRNIKNKSVRPFAIDELLSDIDDFAELLATAKSVQKCALHFVDFDDSNHVERIVRLSDTEN